MTEWFIGKIFGSSCRPTPRPLAVSKHFGLTLIPTNLATERERKARRRDQTFSAGGANAAYDASGAVLDVP